MPPVFGLSLHKQNEVMVKYSTQSKINAQRGKKGKENR